MESFNDLELGLSLVFGCVLLAFAAEVYYLVWWKKRGSNSNLNTNRSPEVEQFPDDYSKYSKELVHLMFWKKSSSLSNDSRGGNCGNCGERDLELDNSISKELLLKPPVEESVDSELMRLHGLGGPPRFLFSIKEETKEDLESDDGRSRGDRSRKASRTRSLSDVTLAIDTPFFTPLASPSRGFSFNPLFESSVETELGKMMSSPPPKFKFLRDAEEKLRRRLKEDAEKKALELSGGVDHSEEMEGVQVLAIIIGRDRTKEVIQNLPQFSSSTSQVLPLMSSPSATTFRPLDEDLAVL